MGRYRGGFNACLLTAVRIAALSPRTSTPGKPARTATPPFKGKITKV
jgi:hypothetical protein